MTKRAVLVGINQHRNPALNLRGCVPDAHSLAGLLKDVYGFANSGIDLLIDSAATRNTILSRLEDMVSNANAGDALVFGVSAHGTQRPTSDPNEPDGKDECMVTYESSLATLIKDNEINELVQRYVVGRNIKFTAIMDTCHSGDWVRDFEFDQDGNIVESILNRYVPLEDIEYRSRGALLKPNETGDYNVLSACQEWETAADVRRTGPNGESRGAFSYALHKVLRNDKDAPLSQLEGKILNEIKSVSNHKQTPHYVLTSANEPLILH